KPWIDNGTSPSGSVMLYPQPSPTDFSSLITPRPGERFTSNDLEKIFAKRKQEPGEFKKMLCPEFIAWYLQWPVAFRNKFHVPLYVDQFGASSNSLGQLAYENDSIQFMESHGLGWSRWSYNAGSATRMLKHDPQATAFYKSLAP